MNWMTTQQDIETVVDRLLDYVRANGQVSAKKAAKALGLNVAQVEKIALLLEDSNLLEVQYGFSGVVLDSRPPKKRDSFSSPSTKVPKSNSKYDNLPIPTNPTYSPVSESASQDNVDFELKKLEREVLTADNLINFFERDITRRTSLIESLITDLEKRNDYTEEELTQAKKEMATALSQLESFQSEINKLNKRQSHLHSKILEFSMRLKSLKATVNSLPNSKSKSSSGILSKVSNMISQFISDLRSSVDGKDDIVFHHISKTERQVPAKDEEQLLKRAKELASLYGSDSQETAVINDNFESNAQTSQDDSSDSKRISRLKSLNNLKSETAYDQLRKRSKPN